MIEAIATVLGLIFGSVFVFLIGVVAFFIQIAFKIFFFFLEKGIELIGKTVLFIIGFILGLLALAL